MSGNSNVISEVFGEFDKNIKIIQNVFGTNVTYRNNVLRVTGDEANTDFVSAVLENLIKSAEAGEEITEQKIGYVIEMVKDGRQDELEQMDNDCICVTGTGKPIKAKTVGQQKYVEKIKSNTVTFAIGPAGTGKTYLATALAVKIFKTKLVKRIVLTRPAVEAGEKLGFLPGDLQNKVDPYLRPLYDALFDMFGEETFKRHLERGSVEVAPLAYMRGRTLDESFIILDEAQNTTPEQMKMFLTRLGLGSKMVITGDITQIDLPDKSRSGLADAVKILRGIDDIAVCRFTEKDVVRNKLVQHIVKAYEQNTTKYK
jgi:phosphate starvation-inducible PhoH-like protein